MAQHMQGRLKAQFGMDWQSDMDYLAWLGKKEGTLTNMISVLLWIAEDLQNVTSTQ